ncbi:uncharacterized protein LOC141687178 [Apium graveolens]|uniref:uncharacterized protein LOC141687178 n=1 Tax=Apium graveolens TaxID=4045 RepID=UPI003D7BE032
MGESKLILNEAEPVVGKDVECVMCTEPINKLLDAFYRCNTSLIDGSPSTNCVGFFMHKTCSELPLTFTHPMYPEQPLSLRERPSKKQLFCSCRVCEGVFQGFMYSFDNYDICHVCLKCVKFELRPLEYRFRWHPGHNHPLTLVESPALFQCHACNTTATDLSYICTTCCFYIHKSCANAPIIYQSKFHSQHPLILNYSLPQEREFFWSCGICDKFINRSNWVYYCANCRFFAHVKCASSTEMLRATDDDSGESNLMHLPAHDETSLNKMMQQCIMTKATDALLHKSAEPSPYINHWGHEHQLALRNKSAKPSTLDLNQKLEDKELLVCDGCTKPIFLVDDVFYECNSCNFFLHRSCALFPEKMEHHLAGKLVGNKFNEYNIFRCRGCYIISDGIVMWNEAACFDIGCASLPRKIKHEGHRHTLNQLECPDDNYCRACICENVGEKEAIMYGCEKCGFYLHSQCALRPRLVKHRWDSHPLYLILSPQNVADHPHEYDCEYCSIKIDPSGWFYHCSTCDLSFHINCLDPFVWVSNMKFGATNIHGDSNSHQHSLTLVPNKKKRRCQICGRDAFCLPVLECSPCNYIVHAYCVGKCYTSQNRYFGS